MVSFIFVARIRILHYMHVNHLRALWMFNSHVLEKPLHSAWRIRLVESTCRYTSSSFQNWILWFLCAFFLLFFYVKRKIHSCVSGKRGWDAAWIWKTIQKFNFSIGWLLLANRSNARTQKSTLKNIKIFLLFIHLKVPKMRIEIENSKYEKKKMFFLVCVHVCHRSCCFPVRFHSMNFTGIFRWSTNQCVCCWFFFISERNEKKISEISKRIIQ